MMEDKVARASKKDKFPMLVVCHLLQILTSLAFWIQFAVLPARIKKLGADTTVYGYIGTVDALCVLVGAPALGLFSDAFGPRQSLILASFSNVMKYSIVAMGNSIPMLYVSRLFAMTANPNQAIQIVVSGLSEEHERTGALGKLRLTGVIGRVLGPVTGGFIISHTSEEYAAGLAVAMSLLCSAIAIATLPSTTRGALKGAEVDTNDAKTPGQNGVLHAEPVLSLLRMPTMLHILLQRMAADVSLELLHTIFILVGLESASSPQEFGMTISFFGLAAMLFQGLAVGPISKKFSDGAIVRWSLVALSAAYITMAFGGYSIPAVTIIVFLPMLLNTVLDSATYKSVPDTLVGTALGMNTAITCSTKALGPSIGAYMFSAFGYPGVAMLGSMICGAVALITGVSSTATGN